MDAVPVLKMALKDDESLIRAHAVWALGELLGEAVRPLLRTLSKETEVIVLKEINRIQDAF